MDLVTEDVNEAHVFSVGLAIYAVCFWWCQCTPFATKAIRGSHAKGRFLQEARF